MEESIYKITFPNDVEFTLDKSTIDKIPKLTEMFKTTKVISITEFNGRTFSQILTFIRCKNMNGECDDFIEKMLDDIKANDLFDLVYAADYLQIPILVELVTKKFKKIVNDNNPDAIGHILGIENDFSVDERKEIDKEMSFIF